MWFAWYSLNPETLVIPGPGEVPAKLLSLNPPGVDDPAEKTNSATPPPAFAAPGEPIPDAPGTAPTSRP